MLVIFLIYIEDGFPILFSEESAGWDGRRFSVHKLRIYKKNSLTKKLQTNEKEYLKIGKIIEKFRFDEVAQFFNVLKGDMSIVGPRPHILQDDLTYAKVFKMFLKRNKAAPGLTGWAQVNGRDDLSIEEKVRYEEEYLNNMSFIFDLKILWLTILKVLKKQDVSH